MDITQSGTSFTCTLKGETRAIDWRAEKLPSQLACE